MFFLKEGIFFLKSQNVCFFNSEMYCDNDLFMILNLFLKMFLCSAWYFSYLNVNACYSNNRLFVFVISLEYRA